MDERIIARIAEKYKSIEAFLDECSKRVWAATEARALGRGGINAVRTAIGIGYLPLKRGFQELDNPSDSQRLRKTGGGRKKKTEHDTTLLSDLKLIIDPLTRGNPMNPLLWTSKSLSRIKAALQEKGHTVGITTIRLELKTSGYSLQSNRKRREGEDHPDRNSQFE